MAVYVLLSVVSQARLPESVWSCRWDGRQGNVCQRSWKSDEFHSLQSEMHRLEVVMFERSIPTLAACLAQTRAQPPSITPRRR